MPSCLLCTSIVAGCSKDTTTTDGNGGQQTAAAQGMFERPDLFGEIEEINGNGESSRATIKVIQAAPKLETAV